MAYVVSELTELPEFQQGLATARASMTRQASASVDRGGVFRVRQAEECSTTSELREGRANCVSCRPEGLTRAD